VTGLALPQTLPLNSATVIWLLSLLSVVFVSVISFVGVSIVSLMEKDLRKAVLYLVSFSAGGLFGGAFIHLIPEAMLEGTPGLRVPLLVLAGIIISFSVETFLQWRHCHIPTSSDHPHPLAYMNLFGDAVHNFIDGLIVGGSYLTSVKLGLTTTIAVVFHEIPQEMGDFGVLVYGGFDKSRALVFNFLTALTSVFGVIVALSLGSLFQNFIAYLVPFAAGNFIYIAGSDLVPELHKEETEPLQAALQLTAFIFGVLVLLMLALIG
jgi:zinc and cadmium transporter